MTDEEEVVPLELDPPPDKRTDKEREEAVRKLVETENENAPGGD